LVPGRFASAPVRPVIWTTACRWAGHLYVSHEDREFSTEELGTMYAIVKTGGKQYKVAEGDVIEVEKLDAAPGAEVALPAILLVDGDTVTHDADKLAKVNVTGQVVAQTKGPKIRIHKFKNKTGYHKRMGHRQRLTQLRVTGISNGK
jgi:large subunit ribosomal protein L21